jgi:hypothetical protein
MRIGADGSPAQVPSLLGRQEGFAAEDASVPRLLGAGQAATPQKGSADQVELSPEAQEQLSKLKARDQHVRAHEAAHMAAGGSLVRGGATYSYQQGPDGKRYAVGGEVGLDASPVPDNPQATIAKAERLRAAAMAPSDPSGQDRAVAAQAAAMAAQAASELAKAKPSAEAQDAGSTGTRLNRVG